MDHEAEQRTTQESPGEALAPEAAAPLDDARRDKMEKIRKAIADGTYKVSTEDVARKLIEHMLEPKE